MNDDREGMPWWSVLVLLFIAAEMAVLSFKLTVLINAVKALAK